MSTSGYHSFNTTNSDAVPINREVPDTRREACRNIVYDISKLAKTSVIIIFHNEARSTLLRTIHSVLERTHPDLLLEIILVDDASDYEWLLDPLTDYVAHFDKLKLIRLPSRQGLIRARLRGAEEANGDVLFFLDAHSEVNHVWLEHGDT